MGLLISIQKIVWANDHHNATTAVNDSISLAAFNFVQDQLQRPHVEEVRYDIDADRFYWKGPDRKIDVDWRVV
jgi:hypothetical protein